MKFPPILAAVTTAVCAALPFGVGGEAGTGVAEARKKDSWTGLSESQKDEIIIRGLAGEKHPLYPGGNLGRLAHLGFVTWEHMRGEATIHRVVSTSPWTIEITGLAGDKRRIPLRTADNFYLSTVRSYRDQNADFPIVLSF